MFGEVDHEAVALLQTLIRNRCVSDPSRPDGDHERANLDTIAAVLDHPALTVERVDVAPGRAALIARLAGKAAAEVENRPSLLFAMHLDVADADPSRWTHDPFGGELIDGEVWGRGAVFALSYLATMTLAVQRMARDGIVADVDVVLAALPDRFDHHGAGTRWLLRERPQDLGTWAITEPAGYPVPSPAGQAYAVGTAANGVALYRVTVERPTVATYLGRWSPTALRHATEIVAAVAAWRPEPMITDQCREMLEATGYAEVMAPLLDPARTDETLALLPPEVAPFLHAQTHNTLDVVDVTTAERSPMVVPGRVELTIEVGLLPGQDGDDADRMVHEALGPLGDDVVVERTACEPPGIVSSSSPVHDAFRAVLAERDPAAVVVPSLNAIVPVITTAHLRHHGIAAYGLGTFSSKIPAPELGMLPGNMDERLDVESITLLAALWPSLVAHLRP